MNGPTDRPAHGVTGEGDRITADPVIAAQLAGLFRRGLARHHAQQRSGEPEDPEITREREEIAAMLAARRRHRARIADGTEAA